MPVGFAKSILISFNLILWVSIHYLNLRSLLFILRGFSSVLVSFAARGRNFNSSGHVDLRWSLKNLPFSLRHIGWPHHGFRLLPGLHPHRSRGIRAHIRTLRMLRCRQRKQMFASCCELRVKISKCFLQPFNRKRNFSYEFSLPTPDELENDRIRSKSIDKSIVMRSNGDYSSE